MIYKDLNSLSRSKIDGKIFYKVTESRYSGGDCIAIEKFEVIENIFKNRLVIIIEIDDSDKDKKKCRRLDIDILRDIERSDVHFVTDNLKSDYPGIIEIIENNMKLFYRMIKNDLH